MKNSVFAAFGADSKKETAGIEVEYDIGSGEPIIVRIARAGGANVGFKTAAEKATRVYRRSGIELASLPHGTQDKITRDLYARHVVIGWSGMYDEPTPEQIANTPEGETPKGDPIPFSEAKCIELFTELPDFLNFIIAEATAFQNFRRASVTAEAGN